MNSHENIARQGISDARLIAQEFLKNFDKNPLSVIVTGSYAEGLATKKSDLDLVLIAGHATDFGCRSGEYIVKLIGGRNVQALVLEAEEFKKTLSTFMSRQKDQTAWSWLDYVNRLTHGMVLSGHDAFEKLTEGFERSRLLRMQYLHSLSRALEKYDDLLGQRDEKSARQAIFFLMICLPIA